MTPVYRVIQEALSNARRHSGVAAVGESAEKPSWAVDAAAPGARPDLPPATASA